jgi:hypothetical protein
MQEIKRGDPGHHKIFTHEKRLEFQTQAFHELISFYLERITQPDLHPARRALNVCENAGFARARRTHRNFQLFEIRESVRRLTVHAARN